MKRRELISRPRLAARAVTGAKITTATAGEHCPATGWWIPQGTNESWQYLSEGNLMPAINGQPTMWVATLIEDVGTRNVGKIAIQGAL
jgi:hypothetical protein